MTGSVFNGEVWSVTDLDSSSPKWIKSERLEIPHNQTTGSDMMIVRVEDSETGYDTLYVLSKSRGVEKLSSLVV
jgi:hypothetical protein